MSSHSSSARLGRRGFLALAGALGAGACSSSSGGGQGDNREVMVFAAASLTDVFAVIADDFRAVQDAVPIKLHFAGSQSLRTQIENGASPQVFASANDKHMATLVDAGLVEPPKVFAQNGLVIVVPPDNPAKIGSLADPPRADRIVLAGTSVPAGAYAEQMLAKAAAELGADFPQRVAERVVSRENHVRQTLQKVVLGEADAAIVYATDARAAGAGVLTIPVPAHHDIRAAYPIAVLKDTRHHRLATAFVEHVLSPAGQRRLAAAGFGPPS